jgi:hypothetical protein
MRVIGTVGVMIGLALVPGTAAARAGAAARGGAAALSRHPVPQSARWRSYVLDQTDGLVYPKHVYVVGDPSAVDNPTGMEAQGGGVTTIHSSGKGQPQLILDLGINTGGYVEVAITKTDGTDVHLGYSEARRFLTPDGDIAAGDPSLGNDDNPGSRNDDITAAGNWRSPGIRGAERWISVQLQSAGTVSIDYVRVREEHLHPTVADYTGRFLSSDDLLNRIWYSSIYTYTLDSFKDLRPGHTYGNVVVTDGAKRDRMIWLGDLVVENMLGDYALRQAPRVIRDSISAFACEQLPDGEISMASQIDSVCPGKPDPFVYSAPELGPATSASGLPEYTLWWVIAVHDYDLFTGDDAFARQMLPVIRKAIAYFEGHLENGLYVTPPGSINWHPFDAAGGTDAHTNATLDRALLDTADLERRIGAGTKAAAGLTAEAASVRRAMLAQLWDPTAGAFHLNLDDPTGNHSQDAQVEAVLDGVVTGGQAASALRFIDSRLRTTYGVMNGESNTDPYMSNYISPYISSTELLARLAVGDTSGALDLLRREWGHMVNTDPSSTVWEKMSFAGDAATYSPDQLGTGLIPVDAPQAGPGGASLAHGWAGGPVAALSGYILGIRPTAAGFSSWIVAPQLGDLRFAQGQAPSPYGAVVSRWARRAGGRRFVLTAGGPRRTTGTVVVPLLGRSRTIARDGRVVWRDGAPIPGVRAVRAGDYVRFLGVRGIHTYAWSAR